MNKRGEVVQTEEGADMLPRKEQVKNKNKKRLQDKVKRKDQRTGTRKERPQEQFTSACGRTGGQRDADGRGQGQEQGQARLVVGLCGGQCRDGDPEVPDPPRSVSGEYHSLSLRIQMRP